MSRGPILALLSLQLVCCIGEKSEVPQTEPTDGGGLDASSETSPNDTSTGNGGSRVTQLAAATYFQAGTGSSTCARLANGTIHCWGLNSFGQLGDGSTDNKRVPGPVIGITSARLVAFGGAHGCAILDDATVKCWGANDKGQLGFTTSSLCSPANVPCSTKAELVSGLADVAQIAAGEHHTCALLRDGTVKCWGSNSAGQLGYGAVGETSPIPNAIAGLVGVEFIAAGTAHTCVRTKAGALRCWGFNAVGQLGDGTKTDRPYPGVVPIANDAAEVAANGSNTTCARLTNGSLSCWGELEGGAVLSPKPVSGLASAAGVVVGPNSNVCVWLLDGTARCWGRNTDGQLGDGTTTDRWSAGPAVPYPFGETHP